MPLDYRKATSDFDAYAHYARNIITKHYDEEYGGGAPDGRPLPQVPLQQLRPCPATQSDDVVGIIGAGVGGLYAAMLLQSQNPPIKYEILEASDRTGGRVFTYDFSTKPHDYYVRLPSSSRAHSLLHLLLP